MTQYIAIANADNSSFSVKKNQIIASVELSDGLFIDAETGKFDQELFDSYFSTAVASDPDGAIAEIVGCTWSENSDDVVVIYPIVSEREED
jgi:hypothetical protein